MASDMLIFSIAAIAICFGFFRCIYLQCYAWNYLRRNYYDYWVENILGTGLYGGPSIINQAKSLNDPVISELFSKFDRSLRNLIYIVLACIALILLYLLFTYYLA